MPTITLFIFIITATFIAYTTAHVQHNEDKSQLKKRKPHQPLPPPKSYYAHNTLEQLLYVKAHNDLRKQLHVSPLEWDRNLTASAHDWAVQRSKDCNYRLHSNNGYGENIFWMNYNEFSPSDVVQSWFDEYKLYDHVKNVCTCEPERFGCECGHYLNVIWKNTRQVGCSGMVYCDGQKGVLVVCQYYPPGLVQGINPFTGDKIVTDVIDSLGYLINSGNHNNKRTQSNQGEDTNTKLINQGKDNGTLIHVFGGNGNGTELMNQGTDNSTELANRGKNNDTNIHINGGKDNVTEVINQGKSNDTNIHINGGNGTEVINQGKSNGTELNNQGKDNDTEIPINGGKSNETEVVNQGKYNNTKPINQGKDNATQT